ECGGGVVRWGECVAGVGRLVEGIRGCEIAARAMPGLAEPKLTEGHALEARGRFDVAATAYREAIDREPSSWSAAHSLLALRAGRGDIARAVEELAALRGRDAGSWPLETTYADALLRQGRTAAAGQATRGSRALAPSRAETLSLAATIFLAAHRPKDAIDAYRKIVAAQPGTFSAQWGLAKALVQAGTDGEADAAIGALEREYP